MAEDVDYEDYIDIVTTYRCKFCTFTSSSALVLKNHIRDTHVQKSTDQLNVPDRSSLVQLAVYTQTKVVDTEEQPYSHHISPSISSSTPDAVPMTIDNAPAFYVGNTKQVEYITSQNVPPTNINTATGIPEGQFFHVPFSNSQFQSQLVSVARQHADLQTAFSGNQQALSANDNEPETVNIHVNQNNNIIAGNNQVEFSGETVQVIKQQLIGGDVGQQSSIVQVIVNSADEEQFFQEQEDLSGVIQPDERDDINSDAHDISDSVALPNDLHVVIEETDISDENEKSPMQLSYEETIDHHDEVNDENADADIAENENDDGEIKSRELFLCGNCSMGFDNIQDCKNHMIEDHGLSGDTAASETLPTSKADASTQMEPKKKVGRKRKCDQPVRIEPETRPQFSDSDEDWSEKVVVYSTRSRRKCRPPTSLRHDYYLGKTTKKSRKCVDIGYNVKCSVKGCTAKFQKQETLMMHKECHLAEAKGQEPNFKCLKCTDTFFFWKQTRHHMWKIHKVDFDLLTCEMCNSFKTDTYSKLKIHQEIHGSERPYTCNLCDQGYKQLAQLKNHQATTHGNKFTWVDGVLEHDASKWYTPKKCRTCERDYVNAKCLKKHEETVHGTVKPFACTYCDHVCSRKAMLVLHLRTHTQEKPFKCDSCSFETGDHNSLRRHKMRHSGKKPYQCSFCPYKCIQAISFKLHMRNKHPLLGGGGVFNCNLCPFRTVNKLQYENHLNDHNNGIVKAADAVEVKVNKSKITQTLSQVIKTKHSPGKPDYMTVTFVPTTLPYLSSQSAHNQPSEYTPQVIEIPLSEVTTSEYTPQVIEIPLSEVTNSQHVNVSEQEVAQIAVHSDGTAISMEELSKLKSYEDISQTDTAAVQLIYSTLSALSQNGQAGMVVQDGDRHEQETMEPSVEIMDAEGGTTITLQLSEVVETRAQPHVVNL